MLLLLNVLVFVLSAFLKSRDLIFVLRAEIEEFDGSCDRESRRSLDADRRDRRHEFRNLMAVMQGVRF